MIKEKHIAIIGTGIAGMETALLLSQAGYRVTILEKENQPGGHVKNWHCLFPDFSNSDEILNRYETLFSTKKIKLITGTKVNKICRNDNSWTLNATDELTLKADAVVISTGFNVFDATLKEEYGYKIFENVITSADLEKKFKSGKSITTSNGLIPKRIAIIHCVGSRDAKVGNVYCSKICCITGIKQAIELNKLLPESEIYCFYIDLRLYGSKFDELYLKAQKDHNIQFIRGRLSEASENSDKSLQIKAEDTLSGLPIRMNVDLMILLIGMEPGINPKTFDFNDVLKQDKNGFLESKHIHLSRNNTTQNGLFLSGSCLCPMPVNETLENARSCAFEVIKYLKN